MEVQQILLLATVAGNTGEQFASEAVLTLIQHNQRISAHQNYCFANQGWIGVRPMPAWGHLLPVVTR